MSRIVILGFYIPEIKNLELLPNDEVWSMNDFWHFYPDIQPKLCFNIHNALMQAGDAVSANIETENVSFNYHDEYARFKDMEVVVLEHVSALSNEQHIFDPLDYARFFHMSLAKMKSVLASTPAMMLAYACIHGHKNLYLHACNMKHKYFDFTDNTMKGEAITQTMPLIWFIDYLRQHYDMQITWPAEAELRKSYGNQALFWSPSEADVMYGEHPLVSIMVQK